MDIPDWLRWIMLALAPVQLLFAYRAVRLLLGAERGERTGRWLDVADSSLNLVVICALGLGSITVLVVAAPVMLAVLTWKGVRDVLSRRATKAAAPATGAGATAGPAD
ncbi:hypothetical protein MTF65_28765 [Streptomyces sp. APSN-46.1]|uniref:hypothetical protein n=1 Tax=Streptomyces sp. APSN-46.1 TaxID=2929049 RepID=UPI001FB3CEDE|nr:hypothetical protein [Streptomyces sp. APSN-46.1]MCJ1681276.1 hypothetical protein [Streptomyces sp. APSN-46.1]